MAKRKPHRGIKEIDLDIIRIIKSGTNWQTGIMYSANLNWRYIRKELKKLIEQGYVVSVDFNPGSMKEQPVGLEGVRYGITERARMWVLVSEREAELAPH